uniref:Uncharacterized protein n=1 Tax=Biomphalaria glabrata TaxID=6526 RepID=A0A2C9KWU9_BIOGL
MLDSDSTLGFTISDLLTSSTQSSSSSVSEADKNKAAHSNKSDAWEYFTARDSSETLTSSTDDTAIDKHQSASSHTTIETGHLERSDRSACTDEIAPYQQNDNSWEEELKSKKRSSPEETDKSTDLRTSDGCTQRGCGTGCSDKSTKGKNCAENDEPDFDSPCGAAAWRVEKSDDEEASDYESEEESEFGENALREHLSAFFDDSLFSGQSSCPVAAVSCSDTSDSNNQSSGSDKQGSSDQSTNTEKPESSNQTTNTDSPASSNQTTNTGFKKSFL